MSNTVPVIRELSAVYSIADHPSFSADFECSDKVILPYSVFQALCRSNALSPPLFYVYSQRHKTEPFLCGVLEFTAEEDTMYCPNWILRKIGLQAIKHMKGGVVIESFSKDPLPVLDSIEVYCSGEKDLELLKRGVLNYRVLTKGKRIKIYTGNKVLTLAIVDLSPGHLCILVRESFKILLAEAKPATRSSIVEEEYKTPKIKNMNRRKTQYRLYSTLYSGNNEPEVPTALKVTQITTTLEETHIERPNKLAKTLVRKLPNKGQYCDMMTGTDELKEGKVLTAKTQFSINKSYLRTPRISYEFPAIVNRKTVTPRMLRFKHIQLRSFSPKIPPLDLSVKMVRTCK